MSERNTSVQIADDESEEFLELGLDNLSENIQDIPNTETDLKISHITHNNIIYTNLPIDDDNSLKTDADLIKHDKESLVAHNEQYTKLLQAYVKNVERTLTFKYLKKSGIYSIVVFLFVGVPILMVIVVLICLFVTANYTNVNALDVVPEILAAFGSLVATYITVIKLITNYIFNKDEDKTMEHIISQIQDYDSQLRHNDKSKL